MMLSSESNVSLARLIIYTDGLPQSKYPGDIRSADFPDGTAISVRPTSGGGSTVKIRY